MTYYIANVEIPVIEDIQLGSSRETESIELIDEPGRLSMFGADTGYNIEITASLIEHLHRNNLSVEEQRKHVKSLSGNSATDNFLIFDDMKGFIAIEDVSVPESSDVPTYREATITGIYLPWPKNYPQEKKSGKIGPFGGMFGRSFGGS